MIGLVLGRLRCVATTPVTIITQPVTVELEDVSSAAARPRRRRHKVRRATIIALSAAAPGLIALSAAAPSIVIVTLSAAAPAKSIVASSAPAPARIIVALSAAAPATVPTRRLIAFLLAACIRLCSTIVIRQRRFLPSLSCLHGELPRRHLSWRGGELFLDPHHRPPDGHVIVRYKSQCASHACPLQYFHEVQLKTSVDY